MAALIIGLVAVAGLWLLSAPLRKQYVFGQHLAGLTTWVERIEDTRRTMPPGGIDSLPLDQRVLFTAEYEKGLAFFKTYPRHVINRELMKNYIVASNFGRPSRMAAIEKLLDVLISEGVAIPHDEFLSSYSH